MAVSFAACTSLERQSHYNVRSSNWEGYLFNEKSFSTKMPKLHSHIMSFCTWQSLRLSMSIIKAWFNVLRCFSAKQKLNRHLLVTRIFHLAKEEILQSPLGTWITKVNFGPWDGGHALLTQGFVGIHFFSHVGGQGEHDKVSIFILTILIQMSTSNQVSAKWKAKRLWKKKNSITGLIVGIIYNAATCIS